MPYRVRLAFSVRFRALCSWPCTREESMTVTMPTMDELRVMGTAIFKILARMLPALSGRSVRGYLHGPGTGRTQDHINKATTVAHGDAR